MPCNKKKRLHALQSQREAELQEKNETTLLAEYLPEANCGVEEKQDEETDIDFSVEENPDTDCSVEEKQDTDCDVKEKQHTNCDVEKPDQKTNKQ